jgi:N-acetylmuramoyl-L-alanine amidase
MNKMIRCITFTVLLFINNINFVKAYSSNEVNLQNSFIRNFNYTVCIDAGHGGYDSGGISVSGAMEKDIVLVIALELGKYLKENGVKVVYTRTSDNVCWPSNVKLDLQARCDITNNANADLFISLHANKFYRERERGIESFYFKESKSGKKLAELIQKELIKETKAINRGIKGADYHVLSNVYCPAVLTEIGFLSNYKEEKLLMDYEYRKKCAKAIGKGIIKFLENNPNYFEI